MSEVKKTPALFGLLGEFSSPEALIEAAKKAREAGYEKMDAHSPFPIHGLDEAMGLKPTRLPYIVLVCGIVGLCAGYLLQYWTSAVDYPLNIGGRPLNSIPSFVPISFELTILLSAFGSAFGMLGLNGFPSPYHPVFSVEAFQRASIDKFFLCVEAKDPKFELNGAKEFLKSARAENVYEVEQ